MSPERLLQYFERISEAPDAIPRLRRFILDLAVRGKLVEQNPEDEPAADLIERIQDEIERLVRTGESRPPKQIARQGKVARPFELPFGWEFAHLGSVAVCLDHRRVPVNNEERSKRIAGKAEADLYPYYGATQQQGWIDDYLFDEELILLGEDGVPFLDPYRPKAYVVSGKCWVNNHAHVFRGILVSNRYLVHSLNVFDYSGRVAGATRAKLNQSKALNIPIPLPPLVEQHRIVAKVDELMALCDELEAAQAKREDRRARLVAATLHGLNNGDTEPGPDTALDFSESARFYLNHLPRLTTRPEHIHQLRKTILNLAVRGKLVPQDPEDEPAEELVRQIQKEREWALEASKRSRQVVSWPANGDELPFEAPSHWAWLRLNDIGIISGGMTPSMNRPDYWDGDINWFSPKDFTSDELTDSGLKITEIALKETRLQLYPPGCLFMVARSGILKRRFPISINRVAAAANQDLKILKPFINGLERYLQLMFKGMEAFILNALVKTGTTVQSLKYSEFEVQHFPLPPLAEQHRIVAKVDELMALCDELETHLTTAATTRARLLDGTLHEALNGAGDKAEAAMAD